MTHERAIRSIDRHFRRFGGGLAPSDEAELRAHLPGCAACGRRYERHLLYGRLARDARPAKERLARGLGLRVQPARRRWSVRAVVTGAAGAMAAATLVVLVLGGGRLLAPGSPARGPATPEVAARGRVTADDAAPVLFVYRMVPGAPPALAEGRLRRDDELAFAYSNPGGKRYLWIFGVDEHRHVYWYYPAWPVGTPAPAPFAAHTGVGPLELPDAVRHPLDGGRVDVYAVVSDEAHGVADIEARVAAGGPFELAGAAHVRRTFEVEP